MSLAAPGMASPRTALFTPANKGIYVGNLPGNISSMMSPVGTVMGNIVDESGLTIGIPGSTITTLADQPQNILRITAANGAGYIQCPNLRFSLPFSGAAGLAMLPGQSALNVTNLNFVSTMNCSANGLTLAGQINMVQLTSTIKGYGWADVV